MFHDIMNNISNFILIIYRPILAIYNTKARFWDTKTQPSSKGQDRTEFINLTHKPVLPESEVQTGHGLLIIDFEQLL